MPEKLRLHLGCGPNHLPGFVNIDLTYIPGVDRVDDIRFLRSFGKDTVDEIYSCAVIEHFSRWEIKSILERWFDILCPGGLLRISVPSFEAAVEYYSETQDLDSLKGLLYGGQDHEWNFHKNIWDMRGLERELTAIGFENIEAYDWRETDHAHIDDFSKAYLPHMDQSGKLMMLNVKAVKTRQANQPRSPITSVKAESN